MLSKWKVQPDNKIEGRFTVSFPTVPISEQLRRQLQRFEGQAYVTLYQKSRKLAVLKKAVHPGRGDEILLTENLYNKLFSGNDKSSYQEVEVAATSGRAYFFFRLRQGGWNLLMFGLATTIAVTFIEKAIRVAAELNNPPIPWEVIAATLVAGVLQIIGLLFAFVRAVLDAN